MNISLRNKIISKCHSPSQEMLKKSKIVAHNMEIITTKIINNIHDDLEKKEDR